MVYEFWSLESIPFRGEKSDSLEVSKALVKLRHRLGMYSMEERPGISGSEQLQQVRQTSESESGIEEREEIAQISDEGAEPVHYAQKKAKQIEGTALGGQSGANGELSNSRKSPSHSAPNFSSKQLLSQFLKVQERRAGLYSLLQSGFTEYLKSGSELKFQQLCSRVTKDFNDCSRKVLEIQAALREPEVGREDLAQILQAVQVLEKENLRMTATLQVLRKAGRPSERARAHADKKGQQQCSHSHEEGASALELAESEAEYDAAYKEATRALQEARTGIHDHMEEVRYEVAPGATL